MSKYLTKTLVIVESPAKCKKIEEYLGPGYKCLASYGHIRELKSLDQIDFNNNFKPSFSIIDNPIKKKQIDFLRSEIIKADDIILATDNDREGEAIAWHLCDHFELDIQKTKRIIFNEITEQALQNAIRNPIRIDMNLVRAQQARQILDLLVGFKLSPQLWNNISKSKGLSAGRCQTPALKLIYDNQKEIDENPGNKIYETTGYFTNHNLPFILNKEYSSEEDIIDFLGECEDFNHTYSCSEPKKTSRKQPEPFSTSRLQQISSNELHYSPKETMKICQSLYEAGYITYMRTDSKKYSKEFVDEIKKYITKKYDEKYVNERIDNLINKENKEKEADIETNAETTVIISDKNVKKPKPKPKKVTTKKQETELAQNAHEAIRPTNISLVNLPDDCDNKEKRMYKLIWENTMESCMSEAIFLSITASIDAPKETIFKYNSEIVNFKGWKIVKDINEDDKFYQYFLSIKQGIQLKSKKIYSKMVLKGLKQHYTEARLVQLLEEKGIGRPSTFSSLIDKIQEREYVKKENIKGKEIECKDYEFENNDISEITIKREFGNEKNKLVIQNLGILVLDFLTDNFDELFEYDYTKNMEDDLDKIANNNKSMKELCGECLEQIDTLIEKSEKGEKLGIKIDENHTYIIGKNGPVIKCVFDKDVSFKSVKKDIDINKLKKGLYKLEDIIEEQKPNDSLGKYEGKDLYLKKGKFGLYASWGSNTRSLKVFGNRPIENITFLEVMKYLDEQRANSGSDSETSNHSNNSKKKNAANPNFVREISNSISIRKGKSNDYIFYKTTKMKTPQFFSLKDFKEDYKKCDVNILKKWIKETHGV